MRKLLGKRGLIDAIEEADALIFSTYCNKSVHGFSVDAASVLDVVHGECADSEVGRCTTCEIPMQGRRWKNGVHPTVSAPL